ncbi:MAG: PAS domain-containing protein, partial [Proteobacteria bacterium]|nr:PAS domain-containing protein [Pseudomonadota bacterium]
FGINTLRSKIEHNLMEEELIESEARFHILSDSAPIFIWTTDINKSCDYFNKQWCEFTGLTLEESMGDGWTKAIHPEDVNKSFQTYITAFDKREPFKMEYRLRRYDGEYHWIIAQGNPRYTASGTFLGYVGLCMDINDRKQIEKKLEKNQRMFLDAQRIAHFGSWTWNIQTGDEQWSAEQYRIFGYKPNEIKVTYDIFRESLHPEDRDRVLQEIYNVLLGTGHYDTEFRIVRPDGKIRVVHSQGEVVTNGDGQPVEMVGTVLDITEKKIIENNLHKYEHIVSGSLDALSFIDTNYVYQAANDSWARNFEKSKDEIIGHFAYEVHGKELFENVIREQMDKCLSGHSVSFEYWFELTNKKSRFLDVHYAPYRDKEGKIKGISASALDITEKCYTEKMIKDSRQRLRNLAKRLHAVREEERTKIAREIHDELGQRLTALKIDLSWVAKRLPRNWKKLPERLDNMILLTDSTLDLTRKIALDLRPAILDDLGLEAAIEREVKMFADLTGCNYSLNINDTKLKQKQDRDQEIVVYRVCQEALTNIARHAKAKNIDVTLQTSDAYLRLIINDDGVGISNKSLASTSSLGLFGMYERAGALGGRVEITNNKKGGTEVMLKMPLSVPSP